MKTTLKFLMVLALLAVLLGASASATAAQSVDGIRIGPDTLPNAIYQTQYSQQLTASGGTEPYTFSLESGSLPYGISLRSDGLISGFTDWFLAVPGTYPITIQVQDANSVTVSRAYTFVLDKATPTVAAYSSGYPIGTSYWNNPFSLWAVVSKDVGNGWLAGLPGTAAFSVDGNPVAGCQTVALDSGQAICQGVSMNLDVGEHTVAVAYSPDGVENFYYPASGNSTLTVEAGAYTIAGTLFEDSNGDGIHDNGEYKLIESRTINLDQGCDGVVDATTTTTYGEFRFDNLPGAHCYRISEVLEEAGWQVTAHPSDFWLNRHVLWLEFGNYYPRIILTPVLLPLGKPGVEYNQALTADGGAGPYTYRLYDGSLPDGLTLSEAGLISGVPTKAGTYQFRVQAEDANHAVGIGYHYLNIFADGAFNLTSSSNPSAPGEAVTFTMSAAGSAESPDYGWVPPVGVVTFSDNGTPIEGCVSLYLNYLSEEYKIGDYPATCVMTALTEGTHEIRASYRDLIELYNPAELSLTQQVGGLSDTTPPVIIPDISGAAGQNDWYTGDVSLAWSVTDPESNIISTSGCDPVAITSDQAAAKYTCTAGSAGGTSSAVISIGRDAAPPAVSVTGVTAGGSYYNGSVPQPACSTADAVSGVAANATLTISGGDGLGLGSFTATCAGAVDQAGNAASPVSAGYTVLPAADLSITMTDSKDPVRLGASLVYTLTVTNTGPNTARSLTLTDKLDPGTTYGSVSAPKGWTCKYTAKNAMVTCTSASLDAGSTVTIKITVTVKKTAKVGKELVSTAQVSSAAHDPVIANNTAMQKTRVTK